MKFTSILSLIVLPILSLADTVSFDQTYDNQAGSLLTVACSEGSVVDNFATFGSLPGFPNIGGAAAIAGFGSPNCGTCWNLTFESTTISVLAIDHAAAGFNIALGAMNTLTKNRAEFLGRIDATSVQVDPSFCGL
ncbi:Allergen Asp f 15 [Termitomyces sp. J132]|nr:hypothetical protein H2248_004472 [Termitomyces sp. 'cryptogamus']KNZ81249.1 Allergen Asp f 15 [Termitomyces sp. J132]